MSRLWEFGVFRFLAFVGSPALAFQERAQMRVDCLGGNERNRLELRCFDKLLLEVKLRNI